MTNEHEEIRVSPLSKPHCPRESHPRSVTRCFLALTTVTLILILPGVASASKQVVDFLGSQQEGALAGQFIRPWGIAVNNSGAGAANPGDIYVADGQNNRIQRFGHDDHGTPADTADDTYPFISAWGAGVDSAVGGSSYQVCTVEANCQAGLKSSVGGAFTNYYPGDGRGQRLAAGLAVDQDTGRVYVADPANLRVNVYEGDGTFLRSFGYDVVASGPDDNGTGYEVCVVADGDVCKAGLPGAGIGQITDLAKGIAVSQPDGDPASGTVFLVDSGNGRVNTYNLDGSSPGAFGTGTFDVGDYAHPIGIAVDSRGIVYVDNGSDIERYDSQNANGGGVGFLAPIPVDSRANGFTVDPDSDGAGPDTDVLYVLNGGGSNGSVSQYGPVNSPGLTAPPTAADDVHGMSYELPFAFGLALDESTGRFFITASGPGEAGPFGVYVLDDVNPTLPEGTLDSINEVTGHGFTAHATIDPNGAPDTSYRFQYTTTNFTNCGAVNPNGVLLNPDCVQTAKIVLGHQEDPQAVVQRIEPPGPGLLPNTTYHVRLIFQRRFATEQQSGELTQATLAIPPSLETTGSPLRTATTATLLGRLNSNGSPTTYRFQYGTQGPCDSNPCAETDPIDAGEGQQIRLASEEVSGLEPNTAYHYRIAASNGAGGTVFGSDATLTTRASDVPLSHGEFPGPPDSDRAYEQVSIPDSSGNPAAFGGGARAYASDGNRVLYTIYGGTPISDEGSFWNPYLAERPSGAHPTTGWQTRLITPPRAQLRTATWAETIAGSSDLSSLIALNGNSNVDPSIWRLHADGPADLLADVLLPRQVATFDPRAPSDTRNAYATSADASRVIAALQFGSLDPAFPAAAQQPNLYDVSDGGTPQLASLLPSGQPPACGIFGRGGTLTPTTSLATHWVSPDGSRLYFNASDCTDAGLYVRNLLTAQTKLISGPVLSGPTCPASLVLSTNQAAFIATESRLDPDDVAPTSCNTSLQDNDVYRYDLADESFKCLTCVVDGVAANVGDSLAGLAIDPEGKRLYFATSAQLLPGAPGLAIYRLDIASGDLAYVAAASEEFGLTEQHANISSDGRFLSFYSSSPLLDPLGGAFQNGGGAQHYIYDDETRSLVCASCPPDGSAPLASAEAQTAKGNAGSPGTSGLADDGTLIFATDTPLVGADQNTAAGPNTVSGRDVYEYRDGRPLLVSDGHTSWPGAAVAPGPLAISPSGRDAFFTATARYTQDATDDFTRIYDARIGGGIDFPPASLPPCDLNTGQCEGPASANPEQPGAGSAAFQGPGNQGQSSTTKHCAKDKVKRKGACVAKKHKHKAKQRHHRRAAR